MPVSLRNNWHRHPGHMRHLCHPRCTGEERTTLCQEDPASAASLNNKSEVQDSASYYILKCSLANR